MGNAAGESARVLDLPVHEHAGLCELRRVPMPPLSQLLTSCRAGTTSPAASGAAAATPAPGGRRCGLQKRGPPCLLTPAQGMPWAGPGSAPATPQPAELARLAAQPGLWTSWDAGTERALQRTLLQLRRRIGWEPGEQHVKSWLVIAHTSVGRQVERVLVATDRALYRCAFSFRDGTLGEARRSEWALYSQVHCGPFAYQPGPLPSPGHWYLAREVGGSYGWRLFNRRPAVVGSGAALAAFTAFLHDTVIDNGVYRTFSARIPAHVAASGAAATLAFQQDTAVEVSLVMFALILAATPQQEALRSCVAAALPALPYTASAAALAAVHHALGFSCEPHEAMRPVHAQPTAREVAEVPEVSPWEAPAAGELPKTLPLRSKSRGCL